MVSGTIDNVSTKGLHMWPIGLTLIHIRLMQAMYICRIYGTWNGMKWNGMVIVAGLPIQLPVHHCAPPSTQFHQTVSCWWSHYHRLLQNVERKSNYLWWLFYLGQFWSRTDLEIAGVEQPPRLLPVPQLEPPPQHKPIDSVRSPIFKPICSQL